MISRSHQRITEMANPLCDTEDLTPMARPPTPLSLEVAFSYRKCEALASNSALFACRSRVIQREGGGRLSAKRAPPLTCVLVLAVLIRTRGALSCANTDGNSY
jgi:hypothetical protein